MRRNSRHAMDKLTNYIAYVSPDTGLEQIGHLDLEGNSIQPLNFVSGTPVRNLYQIIEAVSSTTGADGPVVVASAGPPIPVSTVRILPVISGRDVLAVGKNYMEHAKEFNSSGYDSSDKVDRPSHPVIFTKRATSIIAHGEDILLHGEDFTSTTDYEGEIGVILGKPGFRIRKENAWDYVWGYTIINDVTARERQRDHKQFYIGKSADTYCPIGPIAVPKEDLPTTLRLQTHVNGELRQNATTDDLIFPIPELLVAMSAAQTLQPGDVLATGTPAGVGLGRQPPVYLEHDDEISISVTGLSTLKNKVVRPAQTDIEGGSTTSRVTTASAFKFTNAARTAGLNMGRPGPHSLTMINNTKPLSYRKLGSGAGGDNIVFAHGIGATKEFWTPLISTLSLADSATLHLYDFEGHGLSPTHPLSHITIESLAKDLAGIFDVAGISSSSSTAATTTLIAHGISCLAAITFTLSHPGLVQRLILLSPPPYPIPPSNHHHILARASMARVDGGMAAVADNAVVVSEVSIHSQKHNPLAVAAARLSYLGQDPEAYAKACHALVNATTHLDVEGLDTDTLIIAGKEDPTSPLDTYMNYSTRIRNSRLVLLENVGHWLTFEDVAGVARSIDNWSKR